jgi:two-component system, LytTR family, response regulator
VASNQMQRFDGRLERAGWQAETVQVVVGCSGRSVLMKLKEMLRNERLIDVVAACPTGDEILRACKELRPSLVILDTRITSPDALAVASTLHAQYGAKVVLLTESVETDARSTALVAVEYNPQTFDANCLFETARDTLDEIDSGDLMGGLVHCQSEQQQAVGSVLASQKPHHHNQPASLTADNSARHRMLRKLLVRDSGIVKVVPFDDIAWVDAAGDYMCVHALGETLVMRSTLRELIDKLDERTFARIHRSTIVNVEKIVSLTPLAKGAGLLELACGKTLKVSRNYRDSVKNLFQ